MTRRQIAALLIGIALIVQGPRAVGIALDFIADVTYVEPVLPVGTSTPRPSGAIDLDSLFADPTRAPISSAVPVQP